MNIFFYPYYHSEIFEVKDLAEFKIGLRKISEPLTGEDRKTSLFIGEFFEDEFKLVRKSFFWSSYYSVISIKFQAENKVKLTLRLNYKMQISYLIMGTLLLGISIWKNELYPLIPFGLLTLIIYPLGFFRYRNSFRNTLPIIEEIKLLAAH